MNSGVIMARTTLAPQTLPDVDPDLLAPHTFGERVLLVLPDFHPDLYTALPDGISEAEETAIDVAGTTGASVTTAYPWRNFDVTGFTEVLVLDGLANLTGPAAWLIVAEAMGSGVAVTEGRTEDGRCEACGILLEFACADMCPRCAGKPCAWCGESIESGEVFTYFQGAWTRQHEGCAHPE